ncbi:LacI family DNA-binding transcriptional regulator [Rhodoluna limnophila]|uniref:LacI family DNA-binding transcriptional regulator n=1 Tax=Rhodoluna limnophila TaxID=232537 RepID=UPI001105F48B|nr:LacI family DNA-binding transcriptional regulator [Rhodoluna limnophila]
MTEITEKAKPATIYDVALKAGVSKSTVSLVIRGESNVSEEKKLLVQSAIEELDYRPSRFAQQLASHKTRSIGVVITDYKNLSYLGFLKGLREILDDAGYQVIISDLHRSPNFAEDPVDAFVSMKVDGLVLATEPAGLRTHNLDIPCVMIGKRETLVPGSDVVFNDDSTGTRLMLEHLKQLGHQRVAHLTGVGGIAINRRVAFAEHAKELGLLGSVFGEGQPTTEIGGYMGTKELLASGKTFTAIYAANDYMAAGAFSALKEAGIRVPEDVSLAGYDDSPIASEYLLKLTTVDEQGVPVGRQAASLLLERIGQHTTSAPRNISIAPTLVVRGSTAKAK